MPDFQIIQAVSEELRSQIVGLLDAAPGVSFSLDADVERLSFNPPDAEMADTTIGSLYLYHIDIDGFLRNQRPTPDRGADDLFHKTPLPLRLRYLFTPFGEADATNHVVLGLVLQHLSDTPYVTTTNGTALNDAQGAAPVRLKQRFEPMTPDGQAQLWSAFNTALRLSIVIVVEVVAIESGRAPQVTTRIGQAALSAGLKQRDERGG